MYLLIFVMVPRGRPCSCRLGHAPFYGTESSVMQWHFFFHSHSVCSLFSLYTDPSLSIICQGIDSGKTHCREILQSPFFKTKAERVNFTTVISKNSSFCKNHSLCNYILFLLFAFMNVDSHMKFLFFCFLLPFRRRKIYFTLVSRRNTCTIS